MPGYAHLEASRKRHLIATLALAPILLAQGRHVRRTLPELPEPQGPRSGVAGDSAAAGVGASTQDEALSGQLAVALAPTFTLHWKLLAFTGATTADMLDRLSREAAARAISTACWQKSRRAGPVASSSPRVMR